jgi:hypothetical protein
MVAISRRAAFALACAFALVPSAASGQQGEFGGLEPIRRLVGASDGYIDADVHARFWKEAKAVARGRASADVVAAFAAAYGDLLLHEELSRELWQSARESLSAGAARRSAGLGAVVEKVRDSERRTGPTRLGAWVDKLEAFLDAAGRQAWIEVDGDSYTFLHITVAEMLGSVEARHARLAQLFRRAWAPTTRRWSAPGAAASFESPVAISHLAEDSRPGDATYRAMLSDREWMSCSVFTGIAEGVDIERILAETPNEWAIIAKGNLNGAPRRESFRGLPSVRFAIIVGRSDAGEFHAGRKVMDPTARISVAIEVTSKVDPLRAEAWLDHFEGALVIV